MSRWKFKVPGHYDMVSERGKNETDQLICILNPRARAGRAGLMVDQLRRAVDRSFANAEVWITEGPNHATELAARAATSGATIVAAVGGDGTCNEVVNGLFDGEIQRNPRVIFAVIPWGTGGDLAKSLKVPDNLQDALWLAGTGMALPADVGHMTLRSPDGEDIERVFLNVSGFGANGEVVARANRSSKRLGGQLTFLKATLETMQSYQPTNVEISWDGRGGPGRWEGPLLAAFVANAQYCGGGMYVGKGGSMHDGLLDVTLIPPMGPAALARLWRVYEGSIWKVPGVQRLQVSQMEARVTSGEELLLDVDGEQPGALPVKYQVLHRRLQVRGGWLRSPLLDEDTPIWKPGALSR